MAIVIILFTLLTILALFLHWRKSATGAANLPPQPPGLPLLGNIHQLGSLPHQFFRSLSKKHGPLILLHLGGSAATVVVSSAEIAEEIMKTQDLIFASRPPLIMADRLFNNSIDVAFSPYNDYWRKMKKTFIVHLLSSKRVQSYEPVRREEVALLVAELSTMSPSLVNLSERLLALTNDIICRVALGRKLSEGMRFAKALREFGVLLGAFAMADYFPWIGGWVDVLTGLDGRARRTSEDLDEFLEQVLETHLATSKDSKLSNGGEGEVLDFVDVLLSIGEGRDISDASTPLSKDNIKALILDMFVAGTDTTFSALEWAMAELIKNPTLMQEVQREIRDIVRSKEVVEEQDVRRLTYLKAIVKETLRLHVPVALLVPRVATKATRLQGYDIPVGTRVIINAWAIARDPNYWDEPEEFCPKRFINSDVDFRGHHFQYTPFGAGRRICPGVEFGIAAVEYILANLLFHFDWEIPEGMKDEVLDMSESPGITIHKKSGLILKAKLHQLVAPPLLEKPEEIKTW